MSMLKDPNGQTSTMRVMSFIALFASIGFGIMLIADPNPLTPTSVGFVLAYLSAAVGGKALQRFAE